MRDLQALIDGIPLHQAHRLSITENADGIRLEGALGGESARGRGYGHAHGGAVCALLDTAATFALIAANDRTWSTVDLRVDFLRPVPLGPVVVTASVLRAGRSIARAQAELRDGVGRLCATAVGTFLS